MGYKKVPKHFSHRQPIFEAVKPAKTAKTAIKGLTYISPDVDSHNGGAWKAAKTIKALGSKKTRLGTYNENLTVRVGD